MIKFNSKWKFIVSLIVALFMWSFSCANFVLLKTEDSAQIISFVLSLIFSLLILFIGGFKFYFSKKVERIVSISSFVIALLGTMNISILFYGAFYGSPFLYLVNVAFYAVFAAAALFLTGDLRISVIVSLFVSYAYNAISFIIYSFRGTPLMPTDFMAISTAMGVATQYKFNLQYPLITATIMAIVHFMLAIKFPIRIKLGKKRWIMHLSGLLATVLLFLFVINVNYSKYEVSVFNQRTANRATGSAVGFYVNATKMGLKKKADYNPEEIDEKLKAYPEIYADLSNKPNVIAIMNESFSDLSVVGEFETSQDYMPFFDSLKENTVKGTTLVSPFGGYTCNSEYEFLTGMNTGLLESQTLPYMHIIDSKMQYSIVSHMKGMGYTSTAIHPFHAKSWQRNVIYKYMEFDKFISLEDFEEDEDIEYVRGYVTDACNYDKVLEELYSKEEGEKSFIFNITMQNHGGYDYGGYEADVLLENMESEYPKTEQYLTSIRSADAALEEFLNELKKYPEPTVVLFFGDHLPAIENEFYEELYGKSLDDITVEERARMYQTPFMIWANYDIEEKQEIRTSPSFLSNYLMEVAGLPKSRVQLYLDDLQNEVMQLNPLGYYSPDGKWHEKEECKELTVYYDLQYSLLDGENLSYDFDGYGKRYDTMGSYIISPTYIFREDAESIISSYKEKQ